MAYKGGNIAIEGAVTSRDEEAVVTIALPDPIAADQGAIVSHGCVQAVLRALSILKCLSVERQGMTLAEIVRGTRLAPSTAHRLLTTLQSAHFVQFEPDVLRWFVGPQAHMVGSAYYMRQRKALA